MHAFILNFALTQSAATTLKYCSIVLILMTLRCRWIRRMVTNNDQWEMWHESLTDGFRIIAAAYEHWVHGQGEMNVLFHNFLLTVTATLPACVTGNRSGLIVKLSLNQHQSILWSKVVLQYFIPQKRSLYNICPSCIIHHRETESGTVKFLSPDVCRSCQSDIWHVICEQRVRWPQPIRGRGCHAGDQWEAGKAGEGPGQVRSVEKLSGCQWAGGEGWVLTNCEHMREYSSECQDGRWNESFFGRISAK